MHDAPPTPPVRDGLRPTATPALWPPPVLRDSRVIRLKTGNFLIKYRRYTHPWRVEIVFSAVSGPSAPRGPRQKSYRTRRARALPRVNVLRTRYTNTGKGGRARVCVCVFTLGKSIASDSDSSRNVKSTVFCALHGGRCTRRPVTLKHLMFSGRAFDDFSKT